MGKIEMYKETILTAVRGAARPLNAEELRELIPVPKEDNELFREALIQLIFEHKLYFII